MANETSHGPDAPDNETPNEPSDDPVVTVRSDELELQDSSLEQLYHELSAGELRQGARDDGLDAERVALSQDWELWLDELRAQHLGALAPRYRDPCEPSSLEVLYRVTGEDRFGPWSAELDADEAQELMGLAEAPAPAAPAPAWWDEAKEGLWPTALAARLAGTSSSHVSPPIDSEELPTLERDGNVDAQVDDEPAPRAGLSDAPVSFSPTPDQPRHARSVLGAMGEEAPEIRQRWIWGSRIAIGVGVLVAVLGATRVTGRAGVAKGHLGELAARTTPAQVAAVRGPVAGEAPELGARVSADVGEPGVSSSVRASQLAHVALPSSALAPASLPLAPDEPSSLFPEPSSEAPPADPYEDAKLPRAAATSSDAAPDGASVQPPFDAKRAASALDAAAARAGAACAPGEDGPGAVGLLVTFAPSGRVTSVLVSASAYAGTETGSCIARVMRAASIEPFAGAPVTVHKTVALR